MKDLNLFIADYMVNEHLIDSAPQLILILGLPASGKSTFITKYLPEYFPTIRQQTRTLDSDIQLHKRQKESAMVFVDNIYNKINSKEEFETYRTELMNKFNSTDAQQMLGFNFNISTDWDWVEQNKQLGFGKFQKQFLLLLMI